MTAVESPLTEAHYAVLTDVSLERVRQEHKCAEMRDRGEPWHSAGDPLNNDPRRLSILVEEVGEVAREVCDDYVTDVPRDRLRTELVQVAAVAIAWIESIDNGGSS